MEKWHITITENETGKKVLDIDTDAIVAGIDENDGTRCLQLTSCSVFTHAAAIHGVQEMIKKCKAKNPIIAALLAVGPDTIFADKDETEKDSNS